MSAAISSARLPKLGVFGLGSRDGFLRSRDDTCKFEILRSGNKGRKKMTSASSATNDRCPHGSDRRDLEKGVELVVCDRDGVFRFGVSAGVDVRFEFLESRDAFVSQAH